MKKNIKLNRLLKKIPQDRVELAKNPVFPKFSNMFETFFEDIDWKSRRYFLSTTEDDAGFIFTARYKSLSKKNVEYRISSRGRDSRHDSECKISFLMFNTINHGCREQILNDKQVCFISNELDEITGKATNFIFKVLLKDYKSNFKIGSDLFFKNNSYFNYGHILQYQKKGCKFTCSQSLAQFFRKLMDSYSLELLLNKRLTLKKIFSDFKYKIKSNFMP